MKKIMSILLAVICTCFFSPLAYADPVIFDTYEDAMSYIEANTQDENYTYGTSIDDITEEISGVTVEPTDELGYHVDEDSVYHNWNWKTWSYDSGETIVITGGLEEINLNFDSFDYYLQPGDGGTITYTIISNCPDIYDFKNSSFTQSKLTNRDGSEITDEQVKNRIKLDYDKSQPIFREIMLKYYPDIFKTEKDVRNASMSYLKKICPEDKFVELYGEYTGIVDAASYQEYFINHYWTCSCTDTKDIDYNNEGEIQITFNLDGATSNIYQDVHLTFDLSVNLQCRKNTITKYIVNIEKFPIEKTVDKNDEVVIKDNPTPKAKSIITPKTDDDLTTIIGIILTILFLAAVTYIIGRKIK